MVSVMNGHETLRRIGRALLLAAELLPGALVAVVGAGVIGVGIAWL
jgi:hypothetical protein